MGERRRLSGEWVVVEVDFGGGRLGVVDFEGGRPMNRNEARRPYEV